VLTNQEIKQRLYRILPTVQKPGRYVGGEYNQVVKDWEATAIHVALAFPDIYDLGLPNLGLTILYETLNQRPDVLAERVYIPWIDMEAAMREHAIPLYALESFHPVAQFDILGITLPYESLYTNTLNLLDLSGIPLLSKDRTREHPLVIAGGHAASNPEPMAAFIDAFAIGDGDLVIHEIVDAYAAWKQSGDERPALLSSLSKINGVYVPTLYQPRYNDDGTLAAIDKVDESVPLPVVRRIVAKLPPPPTRFLVPSIDVVHNRVSIEIMRGCTRGCRFCHAGFYTRPVRERPVDEILAAIDQALDNTGFEEVALLSLSSSDYTHIQELVNALNQRYVGKHLNISLPSLRIDTVSIDLLQTLQHSRQSGFTLAPEAATERMRNIINKPIPDENLINTAKAIYERGWQTIKLYFMIGHPEETMDDVKAIADLCKQVITEGHKAIGFRASLHAGVSTFVPKPHTPFQWVAMDSLEQIAAKQALLRQEMKGPGLKLNWTEPKETMFEAWLSRGDRRLSNVILRAWQLGAKFDAWQDQYNHDVWMQAFTENGLSPEFYTHLRRSLDEIFPWDHINTGVRKAILKQDYEWSLEGRLRPDCRERCYSCGIVPLYNFERQSVPDAIWNCP
jgi:radical SAM family uncharacterized protein